ncbi:peptidoglycan-binding domain-containing protein [Celeribacter baekdonensis]|uniref:peptidoglycan-binding domain-containing protein n=1 Tax=Celeribacter baekdonensis TaxID=875171 RepID=UPI003A8ED6BA
MVRHFATALSSAFMICLYVALVTPSATTAQNLLVDGGFDGAPQTQFGDRFDENLPPWRFATVGPINVIKNTQNLVSVDGPGGHNYNDRGPESDASGASAGVMQYYIDSGSIPLLAWQYFTPSCRGTATATVMVTNREGHGVSGQTLTGAEVPPQLEPFTFKATQGGLAILQVSTEIPAFPVGYGIASPANAQLITALQTQFNAEKMPFLLAAGVTQTYPWTPMAVQHPVEAGQLYAFMAELGHSVNMDNASVAVACDSTDDGTTSDTGTPVVVAPTDISLLKSCTPAEAAELNGEVGQLWDCSVDVTVPQAPFAGLLSVTDLYTDTMRTTGDVVSSSSLSGNFDCSSGVSCIIDGANFDASGTETLTYSVFVTAVFAGNETGDIPPSDTPDFPMQNCVEGSYDDGTGTLAPVAGNCVSTEWRPRTSATKSCDPITSVSSGPMTLNCQIEVTSTDLATENLVIAGDAFFGVPPMTVSIPGMTMNFTSDEPWSCDDDNSPNTGIFFGVCTLSSADMLAAGGTSTINVSLDFTASAGTGQVANCPLNNLVYDFDEGDTQQRKTKPDFDAPRAKSDSDLPDNCVIIDLPSGPLTTKIDKVDTKKTCDQPQPAIIQGVQGYTWDCRAEVTVTPSPFAGSFTLEDDASNISIGTGYFLSSSVPSLCSGLQTDHLTCVFDGATMTAPQFVSYQLFTPLTDATQPIDWENCITSHADTTAGTFPSVPMCTGRVITPDVVIVDPKEIDLQKACDEPMDAVVNGVAGKQWSCEVTLHASTAPFSGSVSFAENASAVSGTSNANIIGYTATNPNWTCIGTFPQQQTACELSGSQFSSTGVETVLFDLFAADEGNDVTWQNCVSGLYTNDAGKSRRVAGNCVTTEWVGTPTPPEIYLKKGCRLSGTENGNAYYACTIYVTQTDGVPIHTALTLDELFTTTSGASATQYIAVLQGTPNAPNGWDCGLPPFANGASCTISAADFNANSNHRIDAFISIPMADLIKDDFKNCATARIGDLVVGASNCTDIEEPSVDVTFDVEKSCKETGKRIALSSNMWFQPYQCTLTVTINGAPFTGPLWLTENLLFGQNPGAASIQNISSADPWDCATALGQGVSPYCGIQGSQFPASGTSTLTVDVMMNATMDMFGAENCVSLNFGGEYGTAPEVAHDCFEIVPPPEPPVDPKLDITKSCAPAVLGTDGIWTAECEVTVTFENFDPTESHQFYVRDELIVNGPQIPLSSLMPLNTMGSGAWGPASGTPAGYNRAAGMVQNYLLPDGSGSTTLPYTATFSGPSGQPVNGQPMTNCAWAVIPTLNLHAPEGPLGTEKVCVPILFPEQAIGSLGGGMVYDPVDPIGSVFGTGTFDPNIGSVGSPADHVGTGPLTPIPTPAPVTPKPVLTIVKEQTGTCEVDRASQTYDCGFRLRVTNTGTGTYLGPLVITDTGSAPGISSAQAISGTGWSCGAAVANAISCTNPAVSLTPGASTYVDLRVQVSGQRRGGTFQNCATVGVTENRVQRVALIQKVMNDRGLKAGPVDGKPGQKTYTALAQLRRDLGLPIGREFDDALFNALGLPLQKAGGESCVVAKLPAMPAPPLQCDGVTTVQKGESCACRYDDMRPRTATSCQCVSGFQFVAGKGCVEKDIPTPKPVPTPTPPTDALDCDLRSTYKRGDICACIDPKNAKNISVTQCGCTNGLPMISGKCIPLTIAPKPDADGPAGAQGCRIKLNGICIK